MNTRAEHIIISSLLAPLMFIMTLLMLQWNINEVQMIEPIKMIKMNMNDASLQMKDALWCHVGGVVCGAYDCAASMEPNGVVCGGAVDVGVDVASMEPNAASMSGGVGDASDASEQFI
jgi:hypothetical protein